MTEPTPLPAVSGLSYDPWAFRSSHLSMTPTLTGPWPGSGDLAAGSPFFGANASPTLNGRAAIARCLKAIDAPRGSEVLLPSYHCPAMVEAVLWAGLEPVFYPLTPDLDADLRGLRDLVAPRTRVVVAVHYFGRCHDLDAVRAVCDDAGLRLIEDCAHTLTGDPRLGRWGDYAIASLWKFMPVSEGGVAVAADGERLPGRPARLHASVLDLYRTVETGSRHGGFPLLGPAVRWIERIRQPQPSAPQGPVMLAPGEEDEWRPYRVEEHELEAMPSALNLFLARRGFTSRMRERRHRHFRRLHEGLAELPRTRAFPLELEPVHTPYVYPLLLDDPGRDYPALKYRGVPVWRWEHLVGDGCAVSESLRLRLIQLPCHQSLSDEDVEWIIAAVRGAILEETEEIAGGPQDGAGAGCR